MRVKPLKKYRPPRGFRDFPPEIMILRKELISRIEKVFQLYGFDPIDTPSVEYWETLAGKYGDEAENRLIWRFKDPWSGKEYALRYDLTVPLARFISNHLDLPMPFKRYHIGPVWRHEEPQRGRYREFYQCDADIVGSPYPEADAEIINLAADVLNVLGFKTGFRIRLNDRRLLRGIFEEEFSLTNPIPVYRAIDKLDKIGLEGVKSELEKIKLDESKITRILELLEMRGRPLELLYEIEKKYKNKYVLEAITHLKDVIELIINKNIVELDMSLVRGLDYYTGPIIEIVLDKPRIGSVAGGGRYDNLIGLFTGKEIPATGISIGIERIIDAGLELGLYKASRKTLTEAQVIVLNRKFYQYAWKVVARLRQAGIRTRIDLMRNSERVQRRKAIRLGIRFLIFIGEKEINNQSITIYDTLTSKRTQLKLEEIQEKIKELLI